MLLGGPKVAEGSLDTPMISNDMEEINQKIYKAFHDINSIFQGQFRILGADIHHSDQKQLLVLAMPFKITPNNVVQDEEIVSRDLKTDVRHPGVRSGYVIPGLIAFHFDVDLKRALASIGQVICASGKKYTLIGGMSGKNTDGGQMFEITNSGVKDPHPLYKFRLIYSFPNDPTHYFDNGCKFWQLNQNAQEKVQTETRKAGKLLFHLSGSIRKVYDALLAVMSKKSHCDAIELTLEGLKHIITFSDNCGHLSFVYNKLMDLKQSDSVDFAELLALCGLN
ncbi:uncharacterized protein [Drosophila pseudoobscura]|uniref:Uncharacterized protein isoform X2 n=1 Tax=Drosophila pseudoobscura pseudoobscura TaxID=46245 RepID=A0A6I8WDA6_DROPS|nr:uncharacterized protein LOC26533549 isoform X2 [Drosophila pseudoobscura]